MKKKFERPQKEQEFEDQEVAMVFWNKRLHEVMLDPGSGKALFVCYGDPCGSHEMHAALGFNVCSTIEDNENKIRYLPCNNNVVKNKGVTLPGYPVEYETEEKLLHEVQTFIHEFLHVSDYCEVNSSYYVLLSWIFDKLTTVPYLRALGDFGTGKSRFLDVIGGLCYKPIQMSGSATASPIFRVLSFWKGTLLFDEGDRKRSDQTDEVVKIFNQGFQINRPVFRSDKENPNDIEVHPVFGPKVITSRFEFEDKALESRCITEQMQLTNRKDIPINLPKYFYERQAILQSKLLFFRLKNFDLIDGETVHTFDLGQIEPRLKQAFSAFGVLFTHKPELAQRFKEFAFEYQLRLIQDREMSFDGLIVNFLLDCQRLGKTESVTSSQIVQYLTENHNMQVRPAAIGRHLKALNVQTDVRWLEGKAQRIILWDAEKMDTLFKKYNAKHWLTAAESTNASLVKTPAQPNEEIVGVANEAISKPPIVSPRAKEKAEAILRTMQRYSGGEKVPIAFLERSGVYDDDIVRQLKRDGTIYEPVSGSLQINGAVNHD